MKIGSILTEPVQTIQDALTKAGSARAEKQALIIRTVEEMSKIDEAVKGYRHALILLQEESDKI